MAVFVEFGKDAEVSRKYILYNPLYDPKQNSDGAELKLTREDILALKRYVHIILLLSLYIMRKGGSVIIIITLW